MRSERRIPACHKNLQPLYERAVREGRIAGPDDVSAELEAAEEQWEAGQRLFPGPSATANTLRDFIRLYCQNRGIVELTAHARKVKGRIAVEVTESR